MDKPVIAQKSPFVMESDTGTYHWCACGRSSNQPFCDGSHATTSITPIRTEIQAKKNVAWCGCKHSKNAPFCDGSHKDL